MTIDAGLEQRYRVHPAAVHGPRAGGAELCHGSRDYARFAASGHSDSKISTAGAVGVRQEGGPHVADGCEARPATFITAEQISRCFLGMCAACPDAGRGPRSLNFHRCLLP